MNTTDLQREVEAQTGYAVWLRRVLSDSGLSLALRGFLTSAAQCGGIAFDGDDLSPRLSPDFGKIGISRASGYRHISRAVDAGYLRIHSAGKYSLSLPASGKGR